MKDDERADSMVALSRAMVGVVVKTLEDAHVQLPLPQWRALVVLWDRPMHVRELADTLGIHPSNGTRTVDLLVRMGYVKRRENADNRRKTLVVLTPKGNRLVNSLMERRKALFMRALGKVPEEDREAVLHYAQVFTDALGEYPERLLL